jgi:membrane protein
MADKTIEDKLMRFKPFCYLVSLLQKVVIPGFQGMTAYDLIKTYLTGIIQGALSARAGSIAYSFFMAIFPALLFLLNLIPYVPVDGFDLKFMEFIYELIPEQSLAFFQPIISDISQTERGGLLSFVGILALMLMANGVNAIFSGFEGSYNVHINRGFVRQYLVALGVSIVLALLLVITISILIYFEYALHTLRDKDFMSDFTDIALLSAGSYTFFIIMIYAVIATLYFFGTKDGRSHRFFSAGALMTTLLFMLTTYLFGIYIDNFSNYNELYGSIGALLIMMLYIWINSNLILLGFELNAVLRKLRISHKNPNTN